ncbi:unnamed protein product, partial [Brenthis ino]
MKTFTAVVLLAVLFTCEAGRIERRHRVRAEEVENGIEDGIADLSSISEVKHFKIPDVFSQAQSTREEEEEPEDNEEVARHHHHGRARHRAHRY